MIRGGVIFTVETHTAGEPTRIVVGGLPHIPGKTMTAKTAHFRSNLDHIRTAILQEPRGHQGMCGAVITPPTSSAADAGVIFLLAQGYGSMSGHMSMGVTTTLIETGMVEPVEPITHLALDTPVGVVRVEASVTNGLVSSVTLTMAPSFFVEATLIELGGIGRVPTDIVFGGTFMAAVRATDIGVTVQPGQYAEMAKLGVEIMKGANERVAVSHPEQPELAIIDEVLIYENSPSSGADVRHTVVAGEGMVDRSPCGTGTCAYLATRHASGRLQLGTVTSHEGILGTLFTARAVAETDVGGFRAIIPEVTGRAYLTGFGTHILDPGDPFRDGFLLE